MDAIDELLAATLELQKLRASLEARQRITKPEAACIGAVIRAVGAFIDHPDLAGDPGDPGDLGSEP